jgi:hypothetical protein
MTNNEIRERIVGNILDRVIDLNSCTKHDNCNELGILIESYIPEWTDFLLEEESSEA